MLHFQSYFMTKQTLKHYLSSALFIIIYTHCFAQNPPKKYTCYKTNEALIIDGNLEEAAWQTIAWSESFQDIEGEKKPKPLFNTRMKMLWDDQYLYIAAQLEEPHLWATYDKRDMIIFMENNFEVFFDPNGDTHNYFEFEINAKSTIWDLMLLKPYRDGGPALSSWDIKGLKKGIKLQGSLNDGTDIDTGWTVELAFPWEVLKECAPNGKLPSSGDFWRMNFSRVEWKTEWINGQYQKTIDPTTGKHYPEFNWVWSPQGVINMHRPETWGYVLFSNEAPNDTNSFTIPKSELTKQFLREAYYKQSQLFEATGSYSNNAKVLSQNISNNHNHYLTISAEKNWYIAKVEDESGTWYIREDGKIWKAD